MGAADDPSAGRGLTDGVPASSELGQAEGHYRICPQSRNHQPRQSNKSCLGAAREIL